MKLMSNYDIALQLLKIIREYDNLPKASEKIADKVLQTTGKMKYGELVKDTFEKGSKDINEKSSCI